MKTVKIEGKEYEVPDEATCYAMDSNGDWHWYARKGPMKWEYRASFSCWSSSGKSGFICSSTYWKTTFTMIESEGEKEEEGIREVIDE